MYFSYDIYDRGCRDERYKLIEFAVPDETSGVIEYHTLLFDLAADPSEMNNLAEDPEYAETLARMKSLMSELSVHYGDTVERGSTFWKAMALKDPA